MASWKPRTRWDRSATNPNEKPCTLARASDDVGNSVSLNALGSEAGGGTGAVGARAGGGGRSRRGGVRGGLAAKRGAVVAARDSQLARAGGVEGGGRQRRVLARG